MIYIYRESNITNNNYSSHDWDVILICENNCKAVECKFSSYSIQEKHINQIKSFKNKFKDFDVYLISYDYKESLLDRLLIMTNNNLKEFLDNIELISIENLAEKKSF